MKLTPDTNKDILDKYNSGISCADLAKEYDVNYNAIWKRLKSLGTKFQRKKLSKEVVCELIKDYKNGLTYKELAEKYDIGTASVTNYLVRDDAILHKGARKTFMNINFFKTLTKESLWVLGWFYSDGNVSKSKNKFGITVHSNDIDLLHKVEKIMGFSESHLYFRKKQKAIEFYGYEQTIHDDLISLGCVPAKSLIIKYPTFFTENWYHWDFLRGVLEGDGHISLKTNGNRSGFNCEIASGSLEFLISIKNLLKEKLNINSSILERKNSNSKRLCILGGKEPILKFLDLLYKDCPESLRLERKYQVYLKMHEVNQREKLPFFANREKQREGYFLSPDGKIYHVKGLKKFALETGVSLGCLINLLKTDRKNKFSSRKYGWLSPTLEQIKNAHETGALIERFY